MKRAEKTSLTSLETGSKEIDFNSSNIRQKRRVRLTFSLQAVKWTRTPGVMALGFPKKAAKLKVNFSRSSLSM